MDKIYPHAFSIITEEQQENQKKEPESNQPKRNGEQPGHPHTTAIQHAMKIVLRIQHIVKIAFVIFIVPYRYEHSSTR